MKRSGHRKTSILVAALSLCGLFLFVSCSSSEETARSEGDSPLGSVADSSASASAPDTTRHERMEIVTGPTESLHNREVGLTVGERLKQLDSLMQIVPADSLGILMAEYERLLDSAMGGTGLTIPVTPPSTTTPVATESTESSKDSRSNPSYPRSTPRSSLGEGEGSRVLVQSEIDRNSDFDPSEYEGVRESEMDHYRENVPATTTPASSEPAPVTPAILEPAETNVVELPTISDYIAPQTTAISPTSGETKTNATASEKKTKGKAKKSSAKGKKGKKSRAAAPTTTASTPSSSTPTSTESKSKRASTLEENYTEGLAHFRAGRYQKAIESLKPVANSSSSSFRTTAKYYYALSLERTGSLSQAATHFRSLSKGSGALADKGWLGYCRILKAQGKKAEAKKELLRLIQSRPNSSQIADARQMLQKL